MIILPPTVCPECSGSIVEYTEPKSEIVTHWCENEECPGRIADMLTFIASRRLLEIEGLGPQMALLLAKGKYVITAADLFEFCNDIAIGLAAHGEERISRLIKGNLKLPVADTLKMVATCERAKVASWDRWIAALGIPMIGVSLGKTLAKELDLQPNDMNVLSTRLELMQTLEVEGIGFHKKAEIERYRVSERFKTILSRLYAAGIRPTSMERPAVSDVAGPLADMVFCITGEFYRVGSREFMSRELVKLGATAKTGVSKKLTHLLVGTEPGKAKTAKADMLKLPTRDEDWVVATFKEHGIPCAGADLAMEWAD